MNPMLNIAIRAARKAAKILVRYADRLDQIDVQNKGHNDYVSEIDRLSEQEIIQELHRNYPDHNILAEESGKQTSKSPFEWVIDPLDGTTNYLHGFPQYSISIALRHRERLECGVVYDPLRDELFTAVRGSGAQLNDRRIRVSQRLSLEGALIGTGFPYREKDEFETYFGMFRDMVAATAGLRRPGSAALDLAYVASGRTDGFWELGLSQWDYAAGALLITEAGGIISDLSGGDKYMATGNIVAGNIKVHEAMLKLLRPHLTDKTRA